MVKNVSRLAKLASSFQRNLSLMGADDPIVPPVNGRILAARLRHANGETINCGHLFVLSRPGPIARRVEQFLAQPVRAKMNVNLQRAANAASAAESGDAS